MEAKSTVADLFVEQKGDFPMSFPLYILLQLWNCGQFRFAFGGAATISFVDQGFWRAVAYAMIILAVILAASSVVYYAICARNNSRRR